MQLGVPQLGGFGHHLARPLPGRPHLAGERRMRCAVEPALQAAFSSRGKRSVAAASCRSCSVATGRNRGWDIPCVLPGAPHHPLVAGERAGVARPGQAELLAGLGDRHDGVLGEGDDRFRAHFLGLADDQGHQIVSLGLGRDQDRSTQPLRGRGNGGRKRAERQQVHCRPCGDP